MFGMLCLTHKVEGKKRSRDSWYGRCCKAKALSSLLPREKGVVFLWKKLLYETRTVDVLIMEQRRLSCSINDFLSCAWTVKISWTVLPSNCKQFDACFTTWNRARTRTSWHMHYHDSDSQGDWQCLAPQTLKPREKYNTFSNDKECRVYARRSWRTEQSSDSSNQIHKCKMMQGITPHCVDKKSVKNWSTATAFSFLNERKKPFVVRQ